MHGPTHLPSQIGSAHESSDLSVGQDLARRDLSDNAIDLLKKGILLKWRILNFKLGSYLL